MLLQYMHVQGTVRALRGVVGREAVAHLAEHGHHLCKGVDVLTHGLVVFAPAPI